MAKKMAKRILKISNNQRKKLLEGLYLGDYVYFNPHAEIINRYRSPQLRDRLSDYFVIAEYLTKFKQLREKEMKTKRIKREDFEEFSKKAREEKEKARLARLEKENAFYRSSYYKRLRRVNPKATYDDRGITTNAMQWYVDGEIKLKTYINLVKTCAFRHECTNYDQLLEDGYTKEEARAIIRPDMESFFLRESISMGQRATMRRIVTKHFG